MSPRRLLFLVRRVGPYHHARFEAAGRLFNLTVVETRPDSVEYPWTKGAGPQGYALRQLGRSAEPETGLRGGQLAAAIGRILVETSPDVVACTGWADTEYHETLRQSHRAKIPVVLMSDSTLGDTDTTRTWWKERMKRWLVRGYATAVVAGTRSREYLETLGFSRSAIFQPWDVVDNDHFAREAEAGLGAGAAGVPAGPYFLCISRYLPKKNLFGLVQAYATYRRQCGGQAWDLVILGSGELDARLRRVIADANLTNFVHLPGFIQYDRLPVFYARAGACVLPSLSDQWGLAINEAMACGLPVIVSSGCGCAPDLVTDGENGWVFAPEDTARLSALLQQVAALPASERERMGAASRVRIARYMPADFATALHAAAESALKRPARIAVTTNLLLAALSGRA